MTNRAPIPFRYKFRMRLYRSADGGFMWQWFLGVVSVQVLWRYRPFFDCWYPGTRVSSFSLGWIPWRVEAGQLLPMWTVWERQVAEGVTGR